ncbi:hypothetical protein [Streptomyces sp. NPDC004682]
MAELHTTLDTYRPELRLTPRTREAVHYILLRPPLPRPVLPRTSSPRGPADGWTSRSCPAPNAGA